MTDTRVPARVFPNAQDEAEATRNLVQTPQTTHPAYRLAFQDTDFLLREDLRPVRFQLELLKPELLLDEAQIGSTFVFYGSARIPEPAKAELLREAATDDFGKLVAERLIDKARYYDVARELARLASHCPRDLEDRRHFVVCSGGQFHYFALRKMHFLLRARAVAVFPGGFGTFDETFELLTLIQTGKISPIPVLLYGREFWERVVNFEALAEEGVISRKDLDLFHFVETAQEGWDLVRQWWRDEPLCP
jgi:predicted Rossmann-fold nucleotide-binding protein